MSESYYSGGGSELEGEEYINSANVNPAKKRLVLVETGDALEQQARDMAEERMLEEKKDLKGVGGFLKKIWKHNLAREFYRQKQISLARQRILESGSLYADEDSDAKAHDDAMRAVVERFGSELKDEDVIHAGETREILKGDGSSDNSEINDKIKDLIVEYVNDKSGSFSDEVFEEEKRRLLADFQGSDEKNVRVRTADNFLSIAKELKEKYKHDMSLDDLDKEVDLVIGKARLGVRTEAQYNNFDKVTEHIRNSFVGRFVDETTIASAVAIAGSVINRVAQGAARSKFIAWGTFGLSAVLGSGFAAMRESHKVEDERRDHARSMAKGGRQIDADSKRRIEMEKIRYETVHAGEVANNLLERIHNVDSVEDFNAAMTLLVQAESRIRISDQQSIDLLTYSNAQSVEQERFNLDIVRAQAKVELRNKYEAGLLSTSVGSITGSIHNMKSFDEFLDSALEAKMESLVHGEEGIEEKNELFSKMKRRKVAAAAAKGLASGLVVGSVVQEISALFNDNQEGLVEHAFDSMSGQEPDLSKNATVLEGFREYLTGEEIQNRVSNIKILPTGERIEFPEGTELELISGSNPPAYTFSLDGEVLPSPVHFSAGHLDAQSIEMLREHGVGIQTGTLMVNELSPESMAAGAHEELTPSQYVEEHSDVYKRIHRDGWYDNDTVRPDKNELRLGWGGHHKSGIDAEGNYVFSVAGMKEGGSHHGGLSADLKESLADGKLKMLLSLSKDTQFNPVEVPIDAHGNAIIDPDSEIGKTFFKTEMTKDGPQLKFIGRFAEVGRSMSVGQDGVEHFRIMATDEGKGLSMVTNTIDKTELASTNVSHPENVTHFDVLNQRNITPPPFIPVFGREPLEKLHKKKRTIPVGLTYLNYSGGTGRSFFEQTANNKKSWLSKNLIENPSVDLEEMKEIKDYLDSQDKDHIELLERLSREAGPMNKKCRAAVCIPVAGHQEGETIYESLKSYTYQTADKDTFEVLLLVNHPDKDKAGNEVVPDKTLTEIERFKKDFPDMNVKVMYQVVPQDKARIGYVRKVLNDSALMRHSERGEGSPELALVSNDADNKGIAPEYVENFIESFDENKNVDSYLGQLDFDPDSYVRKPLLHVGIRFFQYLEVQSRYKKYHLNSSGANFALRAKSYAAVGGYTNDAIGEDTILGTKLTIARRDAKDKTAIAYAGPRVSRLYTSSRRAEASLKDGKAPIEMWDKGFSATDDDVRKVDWDESKAEVNFDDKIATAEFITQVQDVLNRSLSRMKVWGTKASSPSVKKALGWLGVKYRIKGDSEIEIIDADRMIKGLQNYKNEGKQIHDRKAGRLTKEKTEGTSTSSAPVSGRDRIDGSLSEETKRRVSGIS